MINKRQSSIAFTKQPVGIALYKEPDTRLMSKHSQPSVLFVHNLEQCAKEKLRT